MADVCGYEEDTYEYVFVGCFANEQCWRFCKGIFAKICLLEVLDRNPQAEAFYEGILKKIRLWKPLRRNHYEDVVVEAFAKESLLISGLVRFDKGIPKKI